jgi:hypothetical protein
MRIELIYFEGCPHAGLARENLRAALAGAGRREPVVEWRQDDPTAPPYVLGHASPTVLVDGRDVTGAGAGVAADLRCCRVAGAPSVAVIRAALSAP